MFRHNAMRQLNKISRQLHTLQCETRKMSETLHALTLDDDDVMKMA